MKLMFIADIHGDRQCLAQALEMFQTEEADYLLVLGDALYHGPRNPIPGGYDPKAACELLNRFRDKIIAVRGNCDSEVDQMVLTYPMMGDYAMVLDQGRRFFLTHGHRYPVAQASLGPGDVYAYGHIHYPVCEQNDEGVFVFNPGSISMPKNQSVRSYGIYGNSTLSVKDLEGRTLLSLGLE
ncbi:MAG: phosphodiesterase [Desulfobacteraceae bacterium]|nr:phosphodiesterase [Desulfobacteraceae bacterium]